MIRPVVAIMPARRHNIESAIAQNPSARYHVTAKIEILGVRTTEGATPE